MQELFWFWPLSGAADILGLLPARDDPEVSVLEKRSWPASRVSDGDDAAQHRFHHL